MRLLPREAMLYVRLAALAGIVAFVLGGGEVDPVFAAPAAALVIVGIVVARRAQIARGGRLSLAGWPLELIVIDLLTATLWVQATALNPRSVGFVLILAVSAIAIYAHGRLGLALAVGSYAAARVAQELIRIAAGQPTPASQVIGEALVVAIAMIVFSSIAENVRGEQDVARLALERTDEAQRERELRIHRLGVLNGLASELAQVGEPLRIARLAWEACGELVDRDSFYIARYHEERRLFHFIFEVDEGRIHESGVNEAWGGDAEVLTPLGAGPTSQVVLTGEPYVTRSADDPIQQRGGTFGAHTHTTQSAVHVPLKIAGRIVGVLSAQSYRPDAFDGEDVAILESLANLVASALATAEHLIRGRELYLASVRALAAAVDARDPYTRSHSARVAALSRLIADEMGQSPDESRRIQLGALLHDIGKIGIPDAILNKPSALTDEEWVIMRTHAALGASILEAVEPLRELVPIVRCHHERHDGTGYPDGLKGAEIPVASAIVAAADAYEVIVSRRSYKAAQSVDFAVSELLRWRGTQFHPDVVDAFIRVIERDRTLGTAQLRRVSSIQHEDMEEMPGPGGALEAYVARSQVHARQLAVLQRLATEISSVLDIDDLAQRLLGIVCESMGYENGFLSTLDEQEAALVHRAAVGPSREFLGQKLHRGQGISWWVIEHGLLQNVGDVRADTRFFGPAELRSSLIVPLRMGDERIGVLGVESTRPNAFSKVDEDLLTAVSHQIAAAVRVARLHAATKTAASTDPLTGLPNRRVFFEKLGQAAIQAAEGMPLAAAVVDLNLLKQVNDRAGHATGDEALVQIGSILASGVRGADVVARIGGDEFAIVFPGAPILAAERIMRRLAQRVNEGRLRSGDPLPTIAWGIAAAPDGAISADALLDAADRAMYRHKERTRSNPGPGSTSSAPAPGGPAARSG